jgi:DNA-binding LacI/PurR family transcriptional regulator
VARLAGVSNQTISWVLNGHPSVVGFGDIPEAAHFWPPLTTVRQDVGELGRSHIAALIDAIGWVRDPRVVAAAATAQAIAAPLPPPHVTGPCLVIRNSVGPATGRP